ncbi:MAG TPA: amidase [Gemmatimonadaceae bacterium]|nr:amidase [Gemmatimonadaceae bacterium]
MKPHPSPRPADGPRDGAISRRELLAAAGATALALALPEGAGPLAQRSPGGGFPSADALPLDEITIAQLQDAFFKGTATSRAVCESYVARIQARNPSLRAVIELDPDALATASALDAERRAGKLRGPLHGVPVLIKDNIATLDRMQTTAGSLALVGAKVPRDAFIAARLRAAGAVILGKANLSEWANYRSTHASSGWSGRGGQCGNPYALDRTPSGSSSGTAAAISGNLCAVGVGTETDGSIVDPSSRNGLVGIKPTLGLVSRAGIVPIAHSQDTAGPICRTVADAAIVLTAIAGVDPRDAATAAAAGRIAPDYTKFLDPNGLKGARIGVPREYYTGYSRHADGALAAALDAMRAAGATIVDPAPLRADREYGDDESTVLSYEFKADLNAYLAELAPGAMVRTLADLIGWNEAHRAQEMPFFGQEIFEKAEARGPLTEQAYLDALAKCRRLSREEGIDSTMDKFTLDALVAPTNGPATPIDLVNGDCGGGGGSSSPAAVAGYPSITVPAGWAFGLPCGISFFGRAWSEPVLIRIAYAFEQATGVRRPPRFLATAAL